MHMTGNIQHLVNSTDIRASSPIYIPNGQFLRVTWIENVHIGGNFTLNNVLLVPGIKCNLIFIAQLIDQFDYKVTFSPNAFVTDITPFGFLC